MDEVNIDSQGEMQSSADINLAYDFGWKSMPVLRVQIACISYTSL